MFVHAEQVTGVTVVTTCPTRCSVRAYVLRPFAVCVDRIGVYVEGRAMRGAFRAGDRPLQRTRSITGTENWRNMHSISRAAAGLWASSQNVSVSQ